MARPPKADYVNLMIKLVSKKLLNNEEVKIADVASELQVSPALVHFYFHDLKNLTDAAWLKGVSGYSLLKGESDLDSIFDELKSQEVNKIQLFENKISKPAA